MRLLRQPEIARITGSKDVRVQMRVLTAAGIQPIVRADGKLSVAQEVIDAAGSATLGTPTVLYRHYDESGALLYVGISLSFIRRLAEHMRGSHWANNIATVKLERFPSRGAALEAERAAIQNESPMHNIQLYEECAVPDDAQSVEPNWDAIKCPG